MKLGLKWLRRGALLGRVLGLPVPMLPSTDGVSGESVGELVSERIGDEGPEACLAACVSGLEGLG